MDNFNWLIVELMAEQKRRDQRFASHHPQYRSEEARQAPGGVRRALAATLVRLGLRLDPAVGESLGAFDLSPATQEARRQA